MINTTSIDALYNKAAQAELHGGDFTMSAKSAMSLFDHVNTLRHNLEEERQKIVAAEAEITRVKEQSRNRLVGLCNAGDKRENAEAELAELRGNQEPFLYAVVKENMNMGFTKTLGDADFMSLQHGGVVIPLFTHQLKSVAPEGLHPQTAKLVIEFATALAEKLHKAEQKYGYSDTWMQPGWRKKCLSDFNHHISKGDPRDVAAYCAFMWYHGWATEATSKPAVVLPPQRYSSASIAGQGITVKDTDGDLLDRLQVIAAIKAAGIVVKKITREQHMEADGFCPYCDIEIELDDE